MPAEVTVAGTVATIVALPPTLHGLQFECVMPMTVLVFAATVNVPLSVPSVAPATVTLEPGANTVNGEVEIVPRFELMVSAVSGTAAPGAVSCAAGPAS